MGTRVHILPVVESRTMPNPRSAGRDEVSRVRDERTTDSHGALFYRHELSVEADMKLVAGRPNAWGGQHFSDRTAVVED
jgi:hypothetical protein